ncbi:MAG: thioredoxin family protein [Candidatus Gastranaerophilaceae bacterium]
MKKNLVIILAIFIIPIIAYAVLSKSHTVSAAKVVSGQPQVIKFSSKLCIDCKKLKKEFDIVAPKYRDRISILEYDVQENSKEIQSAINQHNVSLVPTVIYINKNGKVVNRTEGYVSQSDLEKCFNELLK